MSGLSKEAIMPRVFGFQQFSQLGLVLVVGALLSIGCASNRQTAGMQINDEDVKQIVKGKTTMNDVIAVFGEPNKATPMGEEMIYTYIYSVTRHQTVMLPYVSSGEGTSQEDKLSIVFDKNQIVKTYSLKRGIGQGK